MYNILQILAESGAGTSTTTQSKIPSWVMYVVIGVVLVIFANRKQGYDPYLLILNCESDESEQAALAAIGQKYVVKSKTVGPEGIEVTAEVRLPDMTTAFVNKLAALAGVRSAVLVSYNGDYLA